MTLPSTSLQPLPVNSPAVLPSEQYKRPRQNHPGASKFKHGGQPGNQNARKLGTFSTFRPGQFSPVLALIKDLQIRLNDPANSLDQIVEQARTGEQELLRYELKMKNPMDIVPVSFLLCKLTKVVSRAGSYCIPYKRLSDALTSIAHDPFGWFERGYKDSHISRDANSFFPVSEKSAQYSPLPSGHPSLATNLTDSQWAVLAPLIPPDPHLDWLTGEPPTIIAANRWGFTQYYYTGWFNDMVVMENYHKILQRFPALCAEEQALPSPNPQEVGMSREWVLPSPNPQEVGMSREWVLPSPNPQEVGMSREWVLPSPNPQDLGRVGEGSSSYLPACSARRHLLEACHRAELAGTSPRFSSNAPLPEILPPSLPQWSLVYSPPRPLQSHVPRGLHRLAGPPRGGNLHHHPRSEDCPQPGCPAYLGKLHCPALHAACPLCPHTLAPPV